MNEKQIYEDIDVVKTNSGKTVVIRRERECDYLAVENLVRESFWNVYRPGCMEHFVLKKMRECENFIPEIDFVMEADSKLIGQVVYCRSEINRTDGKKAEVMTFGPICIAPDYKRKGYGKILLDYSIEKAKDYGASALLITGNIEFYGKSGFVPAKTKGIIYEDDPEADYFLAKELKGGFFNENKGTYKDPDCYFVCEKYPEEFFEYEKSFGKK